MVGGLWVWVWKKNKKFKHFALVFGMRSTQVFLDYTWVRAPIIPCYLTLHVVIL